MKIIGIDYSLTSPAITLYNGNDKWNYSSGSCTHFCLASNERQRQKWAEIRSIKTDTYPAWDNDLQRYHGLADWAINCCITAISPERPKDSKSSTGKYVLFKSRSSSISLMKLCSQDMKIFTGDDKTSMSDIYDGFLGNISVTANVAPLEMHHMCHSAIEGDIESASKINSKLDILHDSLFCESNPIPVKWCLHKMGLIKKGIRLPLTWMDEKFDRPLTEGLIKSGVIDE